MKPKLQESHPWRTIVGGVVRLRAARRAAKAAYMREYRKKPCKPNAA